MALATMDDLVHIGAVPVDWAATEARYERAVGLLDKASAIVSVYLDATEAEIALWTDAQQSIVATVTAQCAALGLSFPANETAQQVIESGTGPMRLRLTPSMKADLDMIPRAGRGTGSITVEPPSYSAVSTWGNWGTSSVSSTQTGWSW